MTAINIYKVVVTTIICLAEFAIGKAIFQNNVSKDTMWGMVFAGVLYMAAVVGMFI